MNTERPAWCPEKTCTCVQRMQDQVCAGMPGDLGRLCFNFRAAGGGIFTFDEMTADNLLALRDLLDALDDQLIARGERGVE